jgi:hypothetical protein
MDYERMWDGAAVDAWFGRVLARLQWLYGVIGIDDAAVQAVLLLVAMAGILWLFARRVSTLGYRVNVAVGAVVQAFTLGPVLTFLLIAMPAWVAFRQATLVKALSAFVGGRPVSP